MPAVFKFSEPGGHSHNEDVFGVRHHPDDAGVLLCAVADGMGGQPGGGPAAALAVRAALDAAVSTPPDGLDWPTILGRADRAVAEDKAAGFTTLIGFDVRGNRVRGAGCGDSAAWFLDAGGRSLELTTRQPRMAPAGSGEAFFFPFSVEMTPPWSLLAMTDGVWKYAGWGRIKVSAARLRGQALIDELQRAARLPGSGKFQDDFTLIVIQDHEGEARHDPTDR
ncbi:MAG: SpoIIE family protein phosphatase [Gemmataceae bacterium]